LRPFASCSSPEPSRSIQYAIVRAKSKHFAYFCIREPILPPPYSPSSSDLRRHTPVIAC
jgi:hypothetical protein